MNKTPTRRKRSPSLERMMNMTRDDLNIFADDIGCNKYSSDELDNTDYVEWLRHDCDKKTNTRDEYSKELKTYIPLSIGNLRRVADSRNCFDTYYVSKQI